MDRREGPLTGHRRPSSRSGASAQMRASAAHSTSSDEGCDTLGLAMVSIPRSDPGVSESATDAGNEAAQDLQGDRRHRQLHTGGRALEFEPAGVSQHIRALEEQLGVAVLSRRRQARAADARRPGAARVRASGARQARRRAAYSRERRQDGTGVIRIGAGDAACHHLLPTVLREFVARFPKAHSRSRLDTARDHQAYRAW